MPPPLRRFLTRAVLLGAVLTLPASAQDVVQQVVEHARRHPDGGAPASFRTEDYRGDLSDLPIGVFDSGIGGLTVLEAIKRYDAHDNRTGAAGPDGVPDFAGERFLYLGDQANMPYGNYPSAGRRDFLRELVLRDLLFLLGRNYTAFESGQPRPRSDKPPVKAVVIACNTATAVGLEDVRRALREWGVPLHVIGVIEAGAHATVETAGQGGIAVFATVATCASEAYPRAIQRAGEEQGRPARPVHQAGFPTLAAAIEGNPSIRQQPAEIVREEVRAFVAHLPPAGAAGPIDTLVLGCTHYPLVRQEFAAVLAAEAKARPGVLASAVTIVDPAEQTAAELYRTLSDQHIWAARPPAGPDRFFISVANPQGAGVALDAEGGLTEACKYGRDPGRPDRDDTAVVVLTSATLPKSSAALVRDRLPLCWAGITRP